MIIRVLSFSFCLVACSFCLPAYALESQKKATSAKQTKPTKAINKPHETQPAKDKALSDKETKPEQPEEAMTAPFVTNASITGEYYFAHENFIRDVYVTTPINGKFYFKVFAGQTPVKEGMTIQYYNDVDGVATFTSKGMGVYKSPFNNCNLYFFFKPPRLVIEQEQDCGMAAELGLEPRGSYKQIEKF